MKNAPEGKHSVPSYLCVQTPFYTGTGHLLKKPGLHRNPRFFHTAPDRQRPPESSAPEVLYLGRYVFWGVGMKQISI